MFIIQSVHKVGPSVLRGTVVGMLSALQDHRLHSKRGKDNKISGLHTHMAILEIFFVEIVY